jgi:SAM-dependent methyltransferase
MPQPLDAISHIDAEARAHWQRFYADRSRPVPFFGLAPDENLHDWLQRGLIATGAVLDIGCGNARNALHLARQPGFAPVLGVDYSASAMAWAREEVARAGLPVALHQGSIFELPLAPASLDLIYDSGCFHHMAPHQRSDYVRLVATALRPGGSFGLVCFAPEGGSGLSDAEVYQRGSLGGGLGYSDDQLREIWCGHGGCFDVVELRSMREPPAADEQQQLPLFGRSFLWVMLARRNDRPVTSPALASRPAG